jgi:hypothetical protein
MAQTRKRQKRSLAPWLRDIAETFNFIKWWREKNDTFWCESRAISATDRNSKAMKVTYICGGSFGEGERGVSLGN